MKPNKFLSLNIIMTLAFVIFAYWMLPVKNGFMLRWYDEMSLFEPTRIFFRQFLYYPGGLLRYAGTWLTQLLYYPWLGSSVLIGLWLLLALLTQKAFSLSKSMMPLAFLVPLALLVSVGQLDDAWLSMKSPGYIYFNTLGFIITVCLLILFKEVKGNAALASILGICIACFYVIAGFFALLSAVLCAIVKIADGFTTRKYTDYMVAAIILVASIAVPRLYYTYLSGNTVDNDFLYLKGLPEFLMEPYDLYLWMPLILAIAAMLLLGVVYVSRFSKDNMIIRGISVVIIVAVAGWGVMAERKSEQFRATVLMLQSIDQGNWRKVIGIMSRIKEPPNYTMRVLQNLALVNVGENSMDISGFTPENIDQRHSESFTMTAFLNVPVDYYIGRFNPSYRWAMEHTVQYGKRVFFLKYMVKDAIMNGEIELAKRYNDILLRTMFHKKWAEEMDCYIEDPSLIEQNPEFHSVQLAGMGS